MVIARSNVQDWKSAIRRRNNLIDAVDRAWRRDSFIPPRPGLGKRLTYGQLRTFLYRRLSRMWREMRRMGNVTETLGRPGLGNLGNDESHEATRLTRV